MIGRADIEESKSNVAMNAWAATEAQLCLWGGRGWKKWAGRVGHRRTLGKLAGGLSLW